MAQAAGNKTSVLKTKIHRVRDQNGETTFFIHKDRTTGKIHFSMDGNAVDLSVNDARTLIGHLKDAIKQ